MTKKRSENPTSKRPAARRESSSVQKPQKVMKRGCLGKMQSLAERRSARKPRQERQHRQYRTRMILVVILGFLIVLSGVTLSEMVRAGGYQQRQETYATEVVDSLAAYYDDYEKEIPKSEFETEGLDEIEEKNERLRAKKYQDQRQTAAERIARLRDFAEVREQIAGLFQDGVLRSEVELQEIESVQEEVDELPESYGGVLQKKLEVARSQYEVMLDLEAAIAEMFTDAEKETVREDATRERYDELKARVDALPQRDVAEKYGEWLAKVEQALTEREKAAEEARQRAIEEYRRRQAEIAAAWRILNVPYHSQNLQQIYNGCEAASMLMALQYKGYLSGMDLRTYVELMPKSSDPFTGFTYSIYDLQPKTAPHWIAPAPLAEFGRNSSGNPNVVDITGSSLDALDAEIAAGNPVIIYLTYKFKAPKEWVEGAPLNMHVLLLTGYNAVTGVQRITDPWTQANGATYWDLSRETVESLFNANGKRAVVVR